MKRSLSLALVATVIGIAAGGAQLAACSSSSSTAEADAGTEGSTADGESNDGTVRADSAAPDSAEHDSAEPDSAAPDSAAPDSAAPDSAAPDSAAPDGAEPDGAAHDGAAHDSAAPDSAEPDAADGADGRDAIAEEGGDAGEAKDGSDSAADSSADASDAGDSGCTGGKVDLKVFNYKAWCSLTVAGTAIAPGTLGTTTVTSVCVEPGATLSAMPNGSNFEVGAPPSPFVSGAGTVADDAGTASTTLTSGATCVVACCPFANSDAATGGCSGVPDLNLCQ